MASSLFMSVKDRKTIDLEQGLEYVQSCITKMTRTLEGLPETPFSSEEHMMLYTTIYNMCIEKAPDGFSPQLYDKYKEVFDDYIGSNVLPSLIEKHDEFLLRELVQRWSNHKFMVKWLSRFFGYLDRHYTNRRSLPVLNVVAFTSFRDLVYLQIRDNAKKAVIALIDKEREGEQIDRSLLKNVLDIFIEIGMDEMDRYEEDFEKHMLYSTSNYYKSKATNWIEVDSCPDYMLKVEDCLRRERDRVSHYLHSSTEQKLVKKVQHELLVTVANQLLEKEHSGCRALLKDDKVEDLSRLYRLYHKIPKGLVLIANIFKQHITAEGIALVQQADEAASNQVEYIFANVLRFLGHKVIAEVQYAESQYACRELAVLWYHWNKVLIIRKFIELQYKYMTYVHDCFMNHRLFRKELREAFEIFCNSTVGGSSSAELLATFCDDILKMDGMSDDAIKETFEKVVMLLGYISDKDLFEEFYRKKLALRLLYDWNANKDHEKCMLRKLRQQYGGQFTFKMDGMVVDLTFARDNSMKFEEYLRQNSHAHPGVDLTVTVLLMTGIWPICYNSFDLINLPSEMVKCVEVFKEFYETEYRYRKLTWIYSLGTCHIVGKFEQKTIELVVSTYQAAVLLLFNNADRLSYSEIMSQLNLTHNDAVKLLHSLSCAKYKILVKEPDTDIVTPSDSFEFNSKFTDRSRRIKIPLPPVDERKKVIEDVDKDRRYAIEAAIVRIMKSKKILGHQQLVSECVKQVGNMFKPDIKAIEKRIEDLITRDYLERDISNPNIFKYLA